MENWRVEMTAGGQTLVEVKMQRSIFLGDSLLPLLFVIAMLPFKYALWVKYTKSPEKKNLIPLCK